MNLHTLGAIEILFDRLTEHAHALREAVPRHAQILNLLAKKIYRSLSVSEIRRGG